MTRPGSQTHVVGVNPLCAAEQRNCTGGLSASTVRARELFLNRCAYSPQHYAIVELVRELRSRPVQ
jgi:hypothetical protein